MFSWPLSHTARRVDQSETLSLGICTALTQILTLLGAVAASDVYQHGGHKPVSVLSGHLQVVSARTSFLAVPNCLSLSTWRQCGTSHYSAVHWLSTASL